MAFIYKVNAKGFFFVAMKKIICVVGLLFVIISVLDDSFAKENLRIISLAPSTTEILFALKLDKNIVGVSQLCNYPKEALAKEKVGTFSQPNIEKILSLKPGIIFCAGLEQYPAVAKLKKFNIKIVVSDPVNMDSLFTSIEEIGELTGRQPEAKIIIEDMKAKIKKINSYTAKIPYHKKKKVFIEIWQNPLTTAGRDSFLNELIELAGGVNIAYDLRRAYGSFSPECVIKRNPDCIILAYMNGENPLNEVKLRAGWSEISAVKNKRVYGDIDIDILLRPGPRVVLGVEEIYKKLYE